MADSEYQRFEAYYFNNFDSTAESFQDFMERAKEQLGKAYFNTTLQGQKNWKDLIFEGWSIQKESLRDDLDDDVKPVFDEKIKDGNSPIDAFRDARNESIRLEAEKEAEIERQEEIREEKLEEKQEKQVSERSTTIRSTKLEKSIAGESDRQFGETFAEFAARQAFENE